MRWASLILVLLAAPCALFAQASASGKSYPDGHGGTVYFPLGDVSFADEVVSFAIGSPHADEKDSRPSGALGIPDYDDDQTPGRYVTLGCGGELVLRFVDNSLVDVPGPDLYVFEIGPDIEPTELSVSADGRNWIRVGKISGGKAEVDLAGQIPPGAVMYYVKLRDLETACGGSWPGADIDAVGAIGSARRFSLQSAVLFDVDRAELKPEARSALEKLVTQITAAGPGTVVIEGHTDSTGTEEHNLDLSQRRAQAVRDYLARQEALKDYRFEVYGYGESRPVASNDTPEGRARNRRVDVMVVPANAAQRQTAQAVPAGAGSVVSLAGTWEGSEGTLDLRAVGSGRFHGNYTTDQGRVFFTLAGRQVTGYWVEADSNRRCDTPRDGSYHWGKVKLQVSPDGSTMEGDWTYCDSDEASGTWTWRRVGGARR